MASVPWRRTLDLSMMLYRWEGLEEQLTFFALMKPQRLLIKEVGLFERVIWNLGTSVSIFFS